MQAKTLEKIGLTLGEAKVYLTLVQTGNTTTGELIKHSGVSRSKVYDVLERLKNKGFVAEIVKEHVRHFEATHPSRIVEHLESKKEQLEEDIQESKHLVAELLRTRDHSLEKQEAKVYIGLEGWKTLYKEILYQLTPRDEYLAFGIGEEDINDTIVKQFIRKFHLQRAEKKVMARILMQHATKEDMSYFSDLKYYHYRYLNTPVPSNIAIYKDNIVILVGSITPVAFVLSSKQVAEKYRVYFESLWKTAKI